MILSKEVWDNTSVPQRVVNCCDAGLEGKVGSKEWDDLTLMEMRAVMGLEAPTYKGGVVVAEAEVSAAYREELLTGMGSIASDIVSQILAKDKIKMEE